MTTVLRFLLVLALGALTTGCLTTSPEQQAKRNEERCVNRGYKPADVHKIMSGNILRVMREAEKTAAGMQAAAK